MIAVGDNGNKLAKNLSLGPSGCPFDNGHEKIANEIAKYIRN